jgi:hypothetical protein
MCAEEDFDSRWAKEEFGQAKLKDPRQIRRLEKIATDFMKQPQASINAASGNWAGSLGAYRFFGSPIAADAVLSGHRQKTIERMQGRPVILAVQDTTTLNFTSQRAKQGLGSIGTRQGGAQGFFCHTTLAVDAEGCALGVLDVQSYRRGAERRKRQRTGQARERESGRWLESLARCQEAAALCGRATQIISVADREADFYELFAYAAAEAPAVGVLVRAQHDRELDEGRLFAQLRAQPLLGTLPVEVPRSGPRAPRRAELQIRSQAVRLPAPAHWRKATTHPVLELWALEAWEAEPPKGEPAICWRLLTTLPAKSLRSAVTALGYYTLRWKIELWHKILKSGCRIEERQLESFERLERVLRVDAVIAWRVLFLMTQGRIQPQLPCTVALEDYQWKALYAFLKKALPPRGQPPHLGEAMLLVARLGGFLARKGDGYPGSQVLWRGLAKLETIAEAWLAFPSPPTCE